MIQMERVRKWYGRVPLGLAIRLLILPVTLSIIDFSVTLSFQPAEYWEGDRGALKEANPIARWVLMFHPLLIVPAMMAWYVLMYPLIFHMPARIGLRVIAIHLIGHMIAISGWLIRMREDGGWWVLLLLGTVGLLTVPILGPFRRQWNASEPVHH